MEMQPRLEILGLARRASVSLWLPFLLEVSRPTGALELL